MVVVRQCNTIAENSVIVPKIGLVAASDSNERYLSLSEDEDE